MNSVRVRSYKRLVAVCFMTLQKNAHRKAGALEMRRVHFHRSFRQVTIDSDRAPDSQNFHSSGRLSLELLLGPI